LHSTSPARPSITIPHPVLILGVAAMQVLDPAAGLVESHEVHTGPLLEFVTSSFL